MAKFLNRKKILTAISLLGLIYFFSNPSIVSAENIFQRMAGQGSGFQKAVNQAYGGGGSVFIELLSMTKGLVSFINFLLSFLGIVFFILLLYSGYLWMMAKGEEEQVNKAKQIIKQIIIGLLIIILARVITEFALITITQILKNPIAE